MTPLSPDLILIRRENADMNELLPRSISYFRFLSTSSDQMVSKTNFGSALIVVLLHTVSPSTILG